MEEGEELAREEGAGDGEGEEEDGEDGEDGEDVAHFVDTEVHVEVREGDRGVAVATKRQGGEGQR